MASKSTTNTQILEAIESQNEDLVKRVDAQTSTINDLITKVDRQSELIATLVAMGGNRNQQGQQANIRDRGPDNLTDGQRNSLKQVIVRAFLGGQHEQANRLREQLSDLANKEVDDFRPVNNWVGNWLNWANGQSLPAFPQGGDADGLIQALSTLQPSAPQQQTQASQPQQAPQAPQQEDLPPVPAQDADIPFPTG